MLMVGRIHGKAKGGMNLDFGAFGLKAQEPARITARQIEAARIAMTAGCSTLITLGTNATTDGGPLAALADGANMALAA